MKRTEIVVRGEIPMTKSFLRQVHMKSLSGEAAVFVSEVLEVRIDLEERDLRVWV